MSDLKDFFPKDKDYIYCNATKSNFEALEKQGFKYCKGHKKQDINSNVYFIEIDKVIGLRVVTSICEQMDFSTNKIEFNNITNTWQLVA